MTFRRFISARLVPLLAAALVAAGSTTFAQSVLSPARIFLSGTVKIGATEHYQAGVIHVMNLTASTWRWPSSYKKNMGSPSSWSRFARKNGRPSCGMAMST